MLYLEDYLEMIEHLPAELRDRFTEMREQDLSVQNRVDSLEERQKTFFANCAKNKTKGSEREEYEGIRKEYQKVIEDSSEKVQLAEDSYSLVDKYMRKLDHELLKFKLELEADNRGITEILEKHSLEMDQPGLGAGGNNLKENRHPKKHGRKHLHGLPTSYLGGSTLAASTILAASGGGGGLHHAEGIKLDRKQLGSGHSMVGRELAATAASYLSQDPFSFDQLQPHIQSGSTMTGSSGLGLNSGSGAGSSVQQGHSGNATSMGHVSGAGSYPLQHIGAGGSAIAAAASQAIAATQQLTGRRTRFKKQSKAAAAAGHQGVAQHMQVDIGGLMDIDTSGLLDPSSFIAGVNNSPTTEELLQDRSGTGSEGTPEVLRCDPNEPRYCICNQVSYGHMVACDKEFCPYEWFHYPCVGIDAPPKGKWYCPTCTANMARRKGRK